ncbi:ComF family protein [Pontibacillus litoralis]|uniref:Phosphoribosyltransferase domain-containing protein n=1 Tax=Pontibacillus litoralis JSM 072002 TaxID=1385512 RepID=A0A0A5G589_9BACI|nr:ComF family protein [Pontibacillus litoralis]KGX86318.1 hypothetical protein N784_05050 [Pontibacillus litoralis JSM 072002]
MHCLWCDEELIPNVVWSTFLAPVKKRVLCELCESQFERIKGATCKQCYRPMEKKGVCIDCQRWNENGASLKRNVSVYSYNDWMKEVVAKWKFRGDYVLGNVFEEKASEVFSAYYKATEVVLVPIPLSEERLAERGFNQALMIAQMLHAPIEQPLQRIRSEKQSKKSRQQRMNQANPFEQPSPFYKPVVLIDDIYTTGRTLQFAAETLQQNGCPHVEAFTLIRG